MAAPRYIGKSAFASGTGALTVAALTGCRAGDIIILFVESANQNINTPTGYKVLATQIGTGTAAAAGGVRIATFWKFIDEFETDSTTSVADSGDHTTAIKMLFRDTSLSSSNLYTSATSTQAATTSMVFPAVTPLSDESLIVLAVAQDTDAASTATVGAVTNANLTSITERHDQTVTAGAGGGLAVITGVRATATSTGTSTATGSTSVTHAYHTIALSRVPAITSTTDFSGTISGTSQTPLCEAMRITANSTGQVDVSATGTFEPSTLTNGTYQINTQWYRRQYGTDAWTKQGSFVNGTTGALVAFGALDIQGEFTNNTSFTGLTNGVEYEFALFAARNSATPTNNILFTGSASIANASAGITGTLAATESGSDTFAATGTVQVKGSLSATETGSDTFAATGDVFVQGSLAASETGADTFSATGSVTVQGALSATEAGSDTFAATGTVTAGGVTGTLAATETGSDTFSANGSVLVQGSLAATESGSDAFSATGTVTVQGSLSANESGSDTFAATGAIRVQGALAATESGADTFAATGTVQVKGTLAATESGSDTFAATGAVRVQGTLSATETGADTFASTGAVQVKGALAATESGSDTFASTGSILVQGSLSATESGDDTFAATGTVGFTGITGTMAATETGADTFAASGTVRVQGALSATESGADAFAASGSVKVQGTLSASESGADTFSATGKVQVKGSLAASESGSDTFTASGKVTVKGSLAATESGADTFAATGTVTLSGITGNMAASESGSDSFAASGVVRIRNIYIGNEQVSEIYLGTVSVSEVYIGNVIVFGAVPPKTVGVMAASESGQDALAAIGRVIIQGALTASESGSDTFAATGTAINIVVPEGTLSGTTSNSDLSTKGFQFNTDGSVTLLGSVSGTLTPAGWATPNQAGVGNAKWVRVVNTQTDNTPTCNPSGTFNTWLQLSSARAFGLQKASTGTTGAVSWSFAIDIANDASGSVIVDSGTIVVNETYV